MTAAASKNWTEDTVALEPFDAAGPAVLLVVPASAAAIGDLIGDFLATSGIPVTCQTGWSDTSVAATQALSAVLILVKDPHDIRLVEDAVAVTADVPLIALCSVSATIDTTAVIGAGADEVVLADQQLSLIPNQVRRAVALARARRSAARKRQQAATATATATVAAAPSPELTIVQEVADAMIILDRDGLVRFVNPAAESLLGRAAGDLIGKPFDMTLSGGDSEEIEFATPDGETRVAAVQSVETQWGNVPAKLVSLSDVTVRRQLEALAQQTPAPAAQPSRPGASTLSTVSPVEMIYDLIRLMKAGPIIPNEDLPFLLDLAKLALSLRATPGQAEDERQTPLPPVIVETPHGDEPIAAAEPSATRLAIHAALVKALSTAPADATLCVSLRSTASGLWRLTITLLDSRSGGTPWSPDGTVRDAVEQANALLQDRGPDPQSVTH